MLLLTLTCALAAAQPGWEDALSADTGRSRVETLHTLIKPKQGESRWMEVDWYPSIWEGRHQAAAQGKPLFFMAGSGGAPCAGC